MRDVLQTAPASIHGVDRSRGATIVYPTDGRPARVWPLALNRTQSPCRIDQDKGLRQHRCSSFHAYVVDAYRVWRDEILQRAEDATLEYASDETAYWAEHGPKPSFRAFLAMTRGGEQP